MQNFIIFILFHDLYEKCIYFRETSVLTLKCLSFKYFLYIKFLAANNTLTFLSIPIPIAAVIVFLPLLVYLLANISNYEFYNANLFSL
jgi:hypothetical protein